MSKYPDSVDISYVIGYSLHILEPTVHAKPSRTPKKLAAKLQQTVTRQIRGVDVSNGYVSGTVGTLRHFTRGQGPQDQLSVAGDPEEDGFETRGQVIAWDDLRFEIHNWQGRLEKALAALTSRERKVSDRMALNQIRYVVDRMDRLINSSEDYLANETEEAFEDT